MAYDRVLDEESIDLGFEEDLFDDESGGDQNYRRRDDRMRCGAVPQAGSKINGGARHDCLRIQECPGWVGGGLDLFFWDNEPDRELWAKVTFFCQFPKNIHCMLQI